MINAKKELEKFRDEFDLSTAKDPTTVGRHAKMQSFLSMLIELINEGTQMTERQWYGTRSFVIEIATGEDRTLSRLFIVAAYINSCR